MKYFVPPYYTVIIDDHEVQITSTSNKKRGAALSQRLDTTGYLIVTLIPEKGSRRKITKRVHILVAELVYGQRPEGYHINHKDGVKTNNHPSNLEYCTPKENAQHAVRTGLTPSQKEEKNGNWKGGLMKDPNYHRDWMRRFRASK